MQSPAYTTSNIASHPGMNTQEVYWLSQPLKRLPLNHQAKVFVPQHFSVQQASKPVAGCPAAQPPQSSLDTVCLTLADLPDEVLLLILANMDATTAACCARVSRRLHSLAQDAPLCLQLGHSSEEPVCTSDLHKKVVGLQNSFPGAIELDLSNLPVEDSKVLEVVAAMGRLQVLQLTGCKKLTTNLLSKAFQQGLLSRYRTLCLQRCFQLDTAALEVMLAASVQQDANLTALTMSHLWLASWPQTDQATDQPQEDAFSAEFDTAACSPPQLHVDSTLASPHLGQGSISGLSMLALHNCMKVSAAALQALAVTCSRLQVLLLGGCSYSIENDRAGILLEHGLQSQQQYGQRHSALITALVHTAVQLQHLLLLELSHAPPGVASAVATRLAVKQPQVQVINLCTTEGIQALAEFIASGRSWQHAQRISLKLSERQIQLAVEAAVRCSSASGRHTPLHVAAADGRHGDVQVLLQMGAQVHSTDRSGATPLFSACENGHALCVRHLLSAGAPVARCNTTGEGPLYIAALKGHVACVDQLLAHLQTHNLPWMDKEMYGDGWTPLMAAAVADHDGIVLRLLKAAGSHAKALTSHTNCYGLTAVHVAARRGCLPVLRSLLAAGGGKLASVYDHNCKTPIEVAEHNGRWAAAALLRAAVRAY